ncbi:MAG TPA: hypothetical protein VN732_00940 [Solirubrobacterales bacterium]|nr:hypothetical protein [Solirubrobacterales bacterium]
MPTEEILVLASSKKHGGRCVAGVNKAGEWVRPVSGGHHGLFLAQCGIGRHWPGVLDVVQFGYLRQLDDPAQPENFLIDGSAWRLSKQLPPEEAYGRLRRFRAKGPQLLGNRGKAVPEEEAAENGEGSLALIEPTAAVSLLMRPPEEEHQKLRPRLVFDFGGRRYDLPLTDVPIEEAVKKTGVGEYAPEELGFDASGRVLVTVSLGEAFNGWHHKLAAAVLFLPDPA